MSIFAKLDAVERRYQQLDHELQNPQIAQDQKTFRSLMKEHAAIAELVAAWRDLKRLQRERDEAKHILATESDPDIKALGKEDLSRCESEIPALEERVRLLLLPRDPNDDKNIVLEVRAGAGGDEASLFAEELFRAYLHYASKQGWQTEMMSLSPGNVGGYKEAIATINGDKVFSRLKFESGVHRVQRVPKTEAQGRIHTSTVTVAVLPEADEVDVQIHPNDLRIDVFRSGGAGGQSVNTTDSAVRVTHLPTGTVVICQDEKSQIKNKSKALKVLYSRLKAAEEERAIKNASDARLAQIGTGDRSERIRTYNFPQSRVTDHRIGLTIHQIDEIMKGELDIVVTPLIAHHQSELLKAQSGEADG
jgi:peptide chain release factor 1